MAVQRRPIARQAAPGEVQCQIRSPARFADGVVPLRPLRVRVHFAVKRRTPAKLRQRLRRHRMRLLEWRSRFRRSAPPPPAAPRPVEEFEAGALVRVRSREEIEATLDPGGQLKGCAFLDEMAIYCGTTQRVLKPVRRFVDERDYRVKKARGIYLLEGLMCEGAAPFGPCDRGCLYFWRGDWLERNGGSQASGTSADASAQRH